MDCPWTKIDSVTFPESRSSESTTNFDDNFCPELEGTTAKVSTRSSFEKLPDSSQYLANLEKKLQKIQKKPTVSSSAEKRDLLLSLTGAREGHINRLLNKPIGDIIPYEEDCDQTIDNPLTTTLVRHIAPHLQAVNTVELVELLKADQLEITNSEDTVQLENLFNSKIQ